MHKDFLVTHLWMENIVPRDNVAWTWCTCKSFNWKWQVRDRVEYVYKRFLNSEGSIEMGTKVFDTFTWPTERNFMQGICMDIRESAVSSAVGLVLKNISINNIDYIS
jgi:hypothetical protein